MLTLTAPFFAGLAAFASALSAVARPRQPVAEPTTGEFVLYTLDVAFTPHGPEILSFWMPSTVAPETDAVLKTGDME